MAATCRSAPTRCWRTLSLAAAESVPGVAVLPPPWYGFSAHHMRFPGTITLRAETLMALCEDIVGSLVAHGFRRILIVNGHGGNTAVIDVLASTLGHRHYGKARIATLTYFTLAPDAIARLRRSEPGGMGHACEFETSMVQHLRPELVKPERAETTYPDPGSPYLTTDLLGAQAVRAYHDFADLSPTGTLGDPSLATPEAGAAFFAAVVGRTRRLHRGLPRMAHPGDPLRLRIGVIGLGFFGSGMPGSMPIIRPPS